MAREPFSVLWSLIVTKSMPRLRAAAYTSCGSAYDSLPCIARMPAWVGLSEQHECTCRSARYVAASFTGTL